jgi:cobalt/nickel transport system ATP-binding protein
MPVNILEAQHLYFSYPGGTMALQDLSATIEKGKKIALLGANGTGKSTFLLHLIGVLKPNKGTIIFNQQPVRSNRASLQALRSKVGFVFQDPDSQLFSANVWQEISFGPINLGWSDSKVQDMVTKALKVTGTMPLKDRPTHSLSYGQKKLISIAGVLAMEPDVIILDEPTASLDPQSTIHIASLLNKINQRGTTVIMATHDVDMAYAWADVIMIMHNGRIIKKGNPVEVLAEDALLNETALAKPLVLDVFCKLQHTGYLPAGIAIPRSKKQLYAVLDEFKTPSPNSI